MIKAYLVFFIFILSLAEASAYKPFTKEQQKRIINSNERVVVSLAGQWNRTFDGKKWSRVNLPGSEVFNGKVIYERDIKINPSLIKNNVFHLYFLGLDDQVEVYINDQFVNQYFSGLTPFWVALPKNIIKGENNRIKLIINSSKSYAKQIREYNVFGKKIFSGALREIFLVASSPVWISDTKIKTALGKDYTNGHIDAAVKVSTSQLETGVRQQDSSSAASAVIYRKTLFVQAAVYSKSSGARVAESNPQSITVESERTIEVPFSFDIYAPSLWSPDNPDYYEMEVRVTDGINTIDDIRSDFGFKDIKTVSRDNQNAFLVNQKLTYIKSLSYIEDFGGTGQTLSPSRLEKDIKDMKTIGANAVRVMYGPVHPYIVDLCNRYGLLLLADLPIYEVPSAILETSEIRARILNIAERMVQAYENAPALFGWGLYSNIDEGAAGQKIYSRGLLKFFNGNSRHLKYKCVNLESGQVDLSGFDLIVLNHINRRQDFNTVRESISEILQTTQGLPVLLSYGIPIQSDNHNGYSDPLSTDYQAFFLSNLYKISIEKRLAGSNINSFNDYFLNAPLLLADNSNLFIATTGLVSAARNERLAYRTIQTLFNGEKEPLLNAGSSYRENPISFLVIGIISLIVFLFMLNRFKRFREYLFRSVLRPYNFYADIRDQRIISSFQTFGLSLIICLTLGLFLSSLIYYFRTSLITQYILSLLIPSEWLRELFFKVVWMPVGLTATISVVAFINFLLIALVIKIVAVVMRGRIYLNDTLKITIWSAVPFILLLPIAIILIRVLMASPSLVSYLIIIAMGVKLWVLARIFRSTIVVFDRPNVQMLLVGLLVAIIVIGFPLAYYQINYSIIDYAVYILKVLV